MYRKEPVCQTKRGISGDILFLKNIREFKKFSYTLFLTYYFLYESIFSRYYWRDFSHRMRFVRTNS